MKVADQTIDVAIAGQTIQSQRRASAGSESPCINV